VLFFPLIFLALMLGVLGAALIDRRRSRAAETHTPFTVIVPCYNDADTVADTLHSIFAAWPARRMEVIVINDASTDDSLARIEAVAANHPIRVINQLLNMGKSASLNRAIAEARHDLILCLDADMLLHRRAIIDMLARCANNPALGGVSCPYTPFNKGFLPAMQAIEYSMMRLGQAAGNVGSTLAFWGGCMMIRKQAFLDAGGFSLNAITEDVDLAFKMNRDGWKVEQSLVFVPTLVPDNWRTWLRQKTRWTAGGFQCVLAYPQVVCRNPLQFSFVIGYALMTLAGIASLFTDTTVFHLIERVGDLTARDVPLPVALQIVNLFYGPVLLVQLITSIGFSLFSLLYVVPLINQWRDLTRLALIIPFSLIYFPLYIAAAGLGFAVWFMELRQIAAEKRAW
jgi:biofilm PGA synthesis N-glycosyltransferase PgaC